MYRIEIQLNTSQIILMLASGHAGNFEINGYTFNLNKRSFDSRAGVRYFVSKTLEASDKEDAYRNFMSSFIRTVDAIAFFYSQPVAVEPWNVLISKNGDDRAYLSCFKLVPATSMPDYDVIDPHLNELADAIQKDDDLYNILWLYNNEAKLYGPDHDPASQQMALCQLIESVADTEEVSGCECCGKQSYIRANRDDIKQMIGRDAYNALYGGRDILRNQLAHGRLVPATFLSEGLVDKIILSVSNRVEQKYGFKNKVIEQMVSKIRSINRWSGHAVTVQHNDRMLEDFLEDYSKDDLNYISDLPTGW